MPISNYIIGFTPGLLRVYRTGLLLDMPEILRRLPGSGRLLDVGCGTGLVAYDIARRRPELDITGVDVDEKAIAQADKLFSQSNLRFAAKLLQDIDGQFDCISFMDLLHHVEDADAGNLMDQCTRLLRPGGSLFVKDIDRRGGYFSYFMDRYVSFATPIRLRTASEIADLAPPSLRLTARSRKWKFPQPHIYLQFEPSSNGVSGAADSGAA